MEVLWSPSALREISRIFEYLHEFNPRAAAEVSEGLIAAGDSLANFPHRGRQVPKTEMRELVTSYPYIIRYRITRDAVRILRVRHTSRKPTTP
jgi:addiction module RelE/StbE family toxin